MPAAGRLASPPRPLGRDGVAAQQERSQPDQGAVVRTATQQPHELVPGEPAAERRERGNQLVLAVFVSQPLVLAHGQPTAVRALCCSASLGPPPPSSSTTAR